MPLHSHPVDVGTRAEANVLAMLVTLGYRVLTPYGFNHRYDLAIDHQGRLVRIQCKAGRLRNGRILFNALSTRSNSKTPVRESYEGAADIFAVWTAETSQVYVVEVGQATKSVATLRVSEPRNGQQAGVRWARDHELASALPAMLGNIAGARSPQSAA